MTDNMKPEEILSKLIIDSTNFVQNIKEFNIARGIAAEQDAHGIIYDLYVHELANPEINDKDIISLNFPHNTLSKRAIFNILQEYTIKFKDIKNYVALLCPNDLKNSNWERIRKFLDILDVYNKNMILSFNYNINTNIKTINKLSSIVQSYKNMGLAPCFQVKENRIEMQKIKKVLDNIRHNFTGTLYCLTPIPTHPSVLLKFFEMGFDRVTVPPSLIQEFTRKSV